MSPSCVNMLGNPADRSAGGIVLIVGCVLLYKRIRTRSKAKSANRDSMSAPMMSQFAPSTFSFHAPTTSQPQNTYQPPTRSPLSPAMSGESYYQDSSSSGGSSSDHSHSNKSPMSDHSSQFAFPILSADGHLMAPLPASSRGSWNISEGDLGAGAGRPLPLAPGETSPGLYDSEAYQQYEYTTYDQSLDNHSTSTHSIKAPVPRNPNQKWSYAPTNEEVVGLYPNSLVTRDEDYEQGYEYGYDNGSIRSSQRVPEIQDSFGFHQPQSATYHRSFSAEGEYIRAD